MILGHATLIGHYSKKILSYTVRCVKCAKCNMGHPKDDHDCRHNYTGSAKGMEPDMAKELINNNVLLKNENVVVKVLIGDDDSSTIAAVRRLSSTEIEKWSDFNHTHKAFTSALYTIKLPRKLIEYFSHNFSHAVKQNKGNATEVRSALESIVPHAFGDHSMCKEWCTAKNSDEPYVHKNLPNGKPLEEPELFMSLTKIISRFANNSEKIANCGSTQGNEAANGVIATKNPKNRHYGGSESLNFRVSASICQINIGCQYSSKVYEKLKIVSSHETNKFKRQKDIKRSKKTILSKTIEKKRQRLRLKKLRSSKTAAASRKEGLTYESGISFVDVSAPLCNLASQNCNNMPQNMSNCKIILFDLETTGLSRTDEICQVLS